MTAQYTVKVVVLVIVELSLHIISNWLLITDLEDVETILSNIVNNFFTKFKVNVFFLLFLVNALCVVILPIRRYLFLYVFSLIWNVQEYLRALLRLINKFVIVLMKPNDFLNLMKICIVNSVTWEDILAKLSEYIRLLMLIKDSCSLQSILINTLM